MKKYFIGLLVFLFLVGSGIWDLGSSRSSADIPQQINIQGRLTNQDNTPKANIKLTLTATIYTNETPPQFLGNPDVLPLNLNTDQNGVFNAILDVSNLKLAFSVPYVVKITDVGNNISFSQPLNSVPYAFTSKTALNNVLKTGDTMTGMLNINPNQETSAVTAQNNSSGSPTIQAKNIGAGSSGDFISVNGVGIQVIGKNISGQFGGTSSTVTGVGVKADNVSKINPTLQVTNGSIGIAGDFSSKGVAVDGSGNIGVRAIGTTISGKFGAPTSNAVGVQIDNGSVNPTVIISNTADGPAIDIVSGWLKISSQTAIANGQNPAPTMNVICGKVTNNVGNPDIVISDKYVTANSIIMVTNQSDSSAVGVKNIQNGKFTIIVPFLKTAAFLVINK